MQNTIGDKAFEKACKAALPHIDAIRQAFEDAGILKADISVSIFANGYTNMRLHGSGYEMDRLEADETPVIRHEMPLA